MVLNDPLRNFMLRCNHVDSNLSRCHDVVYKCVEEIVVVVVVVVVVGL